MIISGKQVQDTLKLYTDQSAKAKSSGRLQSSGSKQDEVVLSTKAQEFGQLLQKLKTMPEVREERITELSASVNSGSYHVDAKEIADKVIGRTIADRLGY